MSEAIVGVLPPPPAAAAPAKEETRADFLYFKGRRREPGPALVVEEYEEDDVRLPPAVAGLDAAIKWLLVIGLLLVAVGLVVAVAAMLTRAARGARLGLAWVSVRVVDLEAKETVLVGTFRASAPRCEDEGKGDEEDADADEEEDGAEKPPKGARYAQRVDLGYLLVPSGRGSNLRLVVTDSAWLPGSAAAYARWNGGATEEPGIAPALPAQSGAPEVSFKTRVASSGKDTAATLAVQFVVRTPGPA